MSFLDFYQSYYFLLANIALLIVFSGLIVKYCKRVKGVFRLFIILWVTAFVFFLLEKLIIDSYLHSQLASFDIDGDGFFSPSESTPEKERYMNLVVGDAGEAYFGYLSIFYSFLWAFFVTGTYSLLCLLARKTKKNEP